EIPKLGLGTWLIDDSIVSDAVKQAVSLGYRHIDTAQAYENESGVGKGIRECGISREEIFITSKVQAEYKSYETAVKSIDETLRKTGFEYIDMMLIHCPQPWAEYNKSDNRYFLENRQVWKALEEAYSAGKVRAVGVSNFLKEDIENLMETAVINPMVNQIECHISGTPIELIEYCQNTGIIVEAYSPIAHGRLLNNEYVKSLAEKYNVTISQLCIRYAIQLGTVALPKTTNPDHMRKNAETDFKISSEDMEILKKI
ncbi:MAG: aldo/keto reductase, partial [Ruminococcus sp.]|nr:aldo/keto reductase [Ruminococcus sp.]